MWSGHVCAVVDLLFDWARLCSCVLVARLIEHVCAVVYWLLGWARLCSCGLVVDWSLAWMCSYCLIEQLMDLLLVPTRLCTCLIVDWLSVQYVCSVVGWLLDWATYGFVTCSNTFVYLFNSWLIECAVRLSSCGFVALLSTFVQLWIGCLIGQPFWIGCLLEHVLVAWLSNLWIGCFIQHVCVLV